MPRKDERDDDKRIAINAYGNYSLKDVQITEVCPYDSASLLSRITYLWVFGLFNLGYKKSLVITDLFSHPKEDDPWKASLDLEYQWNRQLNLVKEGKQKKPSLLTAIIRAFGWKYLIACQGLFWGEILIRLTQPLMVGKVVRYLSQEAFSTNDAVSETEANLYGYGIVVTSVIFVVTRQHSFTVVQRIGNNIRSGITILVYKKLTKLKKSSFHDSSDIGKVLNVLANDLNRIDEICRWFIFIICGPLMAIYVVVVSWNTIGVASMGGLTVLLLFIPFNAMMGRLFNKYRGEATLITDKRVRLMSEIVGSMKLIKVYCWEPAFGSLVKEIRAREISCLKKSYLLKAINAALSFVTTRLMLFTSFMIYALMGNTMHPEPVFIIMALFNTIRIPVTKNLPNAVGAGAEAMVAINRVLDILQLEEKSHACNTKKSESLSIGSVQLKNLTVKWSQKQEEPSLSNVDLFIKPQETVMVIGSVGSGKTCLLWSLLNEVDIVSGSVSINGVTSYSPQESWSFGSSIKDNIVMSDTFDAEKYKQVIFSCGLEKDMQSFPKGDETFVGEKGYSLSGGQKARVTLARCAYHESDVYLLDDPLSAVDPQVANHIFDNLIKGYLKNKTVILVTHQLQFVDRVDRIVVMKDGTVESVGTYDELINNGKSSLSALMKNMRQEEEKCHDLQRQKSLSVHSFSQDSVVESMEDTPSQSQQTSGESNIQSEDRTEQSSTGSLSFQVYWKYFSSGGSVSLVVITLIISLASQSLSHFSDLFLSAWTQRRDFKLTNSSLDESILSEDFIFDEQYKNVIVYSILSLLLFVSTLARAILSFILCLRCSIKIHNNVFKSVLRSPMFFFETNPLGRILNRLTRDIGVIDQGIPAVIAELNMSVFSILGILGTSIAVNYWLAIPTFVLTAVSIPIRRYYIRTAREIQRLDSITKSPVFSHIDTMFDGLVTIRAFKLEDKFLKQFVGKVHDSVSCRFLVIIASRIMGLLVDSMTTVYIFALVVLLMSLPKGFISGGDAGVMLSSSLLLIGMFQNCVRTTVDFETQMISVERLFEYQRLDAEDQLEKPTDKFEELKNWPSEGRVVFKDVSMRYFPEGPLVLKNISFSINAAEKIGVVGRTGAGKSSLLTVLFRLIEVSDGTIFIDDQDVSKLGLHLLRGSMSIIPQDPSLFSGTIRRNLDPFSEYQDDQMWTVMKEANLTDNQLTLDSVVTEGGSNLSVGQRQLLCLARALLNNNRILLMDEATANVDQQTDNIIQRTIKATFKESTVITVAHRLNTVIDMDRVLVMDYGRVVEFDEPHHLLQNPNGYFFDMVRQTGIKFQKMLIEMARHHYYKRHGLPC